VRHNKNIGHIYQVSTFNKTLNKTQKYNTTIYIRYQLHHLTKEKYMASKGEKMQLQIRKTQSPFKENCRE